MDRSLALPRPYLSYYPALYPQSSLHTAIHILSPSSAPSTTRTTPPPHFAPLAPRENYDAASPTPLSAFGPTQPARLGDIVLARSGDKAGNANIGFFVSAAHASARAWAWLRSFLTRARLTQLLGDDWDAAYHVERVEFAGIGAVHFVVYGILGRGASGSARLDALGKGVADYLRDKVVEVPVALLEGRKETTVGARL